MIPKLTRTDFWAVIASLLIIVMWFAYSDYIKGKTPATDFFTVREIDIPDFVEGTSFGDVIMVYDRTNKRDFLGVWVVEIHPASDANSAAICANDGVRTYKAGEKPPETVTLKWFIERDDCGLLAGQYVVEATWRIEADGYPAKEYSAVSNVFTVLARDVVPFTQQDKQQLERAQDLLDNAIPSVPME